MITLNYIDFDQWEFCVVWATRISFLDVLSAVPPFSRGTAHGLLKGGNMRVFLFYELELVKSSYEFEFRNRVKDFGHR